MDCEKCYEKDSEIRDLEQEIEDLKSEISGLKYDLSDEEGKCDFCEGAKYIGAEDEMQELRAIVFQAHNVDDICTCTHCVTHRGER